MKEIERYSDKAMRIGKIEVNHYLTEGVGLHWHEFYELEIYIAGSGFTIINGKKYEIKKNMIVFLTPSDIHDLHVDDKLKLINFTFAQEWIENSFFSGDAFLNCITSCLTSEKANWLLSIIARIEDEINSDNPLKREYTQELLSCLLIELWRIDGAKKMHSDALPAIQNAIQYIRLHCLEDITLESVSKISGFSVSYMSRLLHKSIGCSFKKYLTDLRLKHAERLLLYSDTPVTEIAFLCGFNSVSHFLHIFKDKNNMSPRKFRSIFKNNITDKT